MLFLSVLVADQPIVIFTKSEQALNSKVNVFRLKHPRNLISGRFTIDGELLAMMISHSHHSVKFTIWQIVALCILNLWFINKNYNRLIEANRYCQYYTIDLAVAVKTPMTGVQSHQIAYKVHKF